MISTLSQIYSNNNDVFPSIKFNDGFNVIFARVKDPIITDKDSHNLGKTFLSNLIDYCLLRDLDKDHPFKTRPGLFGDFIFFIEVITPSNLYVTIRRKITGRANICIHVSDHSLDLSTTPEVDWKYSKLGVDDATDKINDLLNFEIIIPFNFRKGITYFLRRQADYLDVFQISKFAIGRHKDWKPYMAQVLGLNRELVQEKYELDDEIEAKETDKEKLAKKAGIRSKKYDEIKGLIEIKVSAIRRHQTQLDNFSFYEIESEISEDIVKRIENLISEYNQERYLVDYELQEIENSLNCKNRGMAHS